MEFGNFEFARSAGGRDWNLEFGNFELIARRGPGLEFGIWEIFRVCKEPPIGGGWDEQGCPPPPKRCAPRSKIPGFPIPIPPPSASCKLEIPRFPIPIPAGEWGGIGNLGISIGPPRAFCWASGLLVT